MPQPASPEGGQGQGVLHREEDTGICPSHLMMTGLTSRFLVSVSPSDKWGKRPGLPLPGQQ